jgi:hypothetical protein
MKESPEENSKGHNKQPKPKGKGQSRRGFILPWRRIRTLRKLKTGQKPFNTAKVWQFRMLNLFRWLPFLPHIVPIIQPHGKPST